MPGFKLDSGSGYPSLRERGIRYGLITEVIAFVAIIATFQDKVTEEIFTFLIIVLVGSLIAYLHSPRASRAAFYVWLIILILATSFIGWALLSELNGLGGKSPREVTAGAILAFMISAMNASCALLAGQNEE